MSCYARQQPPYLSYFSADAFSSFRPLLPSALCLFGTFFTYNATAQAAAAAFAASAVAHDMFLLLFACCWVSASACILVAVALSRVASTESSLTIPSLSPPPNLPACLYSFNVGVHVILRTQEAP